MLWNGGLWSTRRDDKKDRLMRLEKDIEAYELTLRCINHTTVHVVSGYTRNVLNNDESDSEHKESMMLSKNIDPIPLEIVGLIYEFVGDHFIQSQSEVASQRIMDFISNTHENIGDWTNNPLNNEKECTCCEWVIFICYACSAFCCCRC